MTDQLTEDVLPFWTLPTQRRGISLSGAPSGPQRKSANYAPKTPVCGPMRKRRWR